MPALSLVGYEDELRPAMEYVFGSSFICDTIENAKKVKAHYFIGEISTHTCIYGARTWQSEIGVSKRLSVP